MSRSKRKRSFILSATADDALAALSNLLGMPKTSVLELTIRSYCEGNTRYRKLLDGFVKDDETDPLFDPGDVKI